MENLFSTKQDAAAKLNGTLDWEWGGNATHNGWVDYAYRNLTSLNEKNSCLAEYLRSVGENPTEYNL